MSPQPPATWWSETEGVIVEAEIGGYTTYGWHPQRFTDLPADAVRLVPEVAQLRADNPAEREAHEASLARLTAELDEARALVELFRAHRNAGLELASDMHDVIHAACHRDGSTWGSVAGYVAGRLRLALGVTTDAG